MMFNKIQIRSWQTVLRNHRAKALALPGESNQLVLQMSVRLGMT